MSESVHSTKIRYAVVGLGHISQIAVLPAFSHANHNSELTAFVSDDPEKVSELKKKYGVEHAWSYDEYDEALKSGTFDVVYIALPNHMHKDFTLRAAKAGIHVLCEKPMALTSAECKDMISACESARVKLMIAYRLHFDEANMKVVDLLRKGKIGEPRFFSSTFSLQVREDNIRTRKGMGGGPLMDIGIYCINAARYIFGEEPVEVNAISGKSTDPRFEEIDEVVAAVLRFSNNKLASFICSFGATDESAYRIVGEK
jgi:predicted dehydrogenase